MEPAEIFRKQLFRAVVLPPLLLGLVSAATFGVSTRLNALFERATRQDRLIARAAAASRLLLDMEKGLDGSRDSGSTARLDSYRKAETRLGGAFDELARLVGDDPAQARLLALIRRQAEPGEDDGPEIAGPPAKVKDKDAAANGRRLDRLKKLRIFLAAFLDAEVARRAGLDLEARSLSGAVLPGCSGGALALLVVLTASSGRRLIRLSGRFDELQSQADRQERERLGLLSEALRHYAIFTLDADGRISGWNTGSERVFGYRSDDVLARHHSYLYSEDDVRRDLPEKDLTWAAREGRVEDVRWVTRKDGFRFRAHSAIVAIRDPAAVLRGFTVVLHEDEDA